MMYMYTIKCILNNYTKLIQYLQQPIFSIYFQFNCNKKTDFIIRFLNLFLQLIFLLSEQHIID